MFIPFSDSYKQTLKDFDRYCKRTGFEVSANVIPKCESSRWFYYAGKPVEVTAGDRTFKLDKGTLFGLMVTASGYKLESDLEGDPPYFISLKSGYVLSKLSTPISRRAQRSAPLKAPGGFNATS